MQGGAEKGWQAAVIAAKAEKDAIKLGAGIELDDEDARVAAEAYVDALGVLPVEPYPMPPKPQPDPPDGVVAELVGAEATSVGPPEFAYLGYHVEVEENSAGWVWRAWRRGKHGGAADLQGGPEKGWQAAVIAAKKLLTGFPG